MSTSTMGARWTCPIAGTSPVSFRLDDAGVLTHSRLHRQPLVQFPRQHAHANPRAGLVFVDFDTGDQLQLTGDAQVILDSPETATFLGADALLAIHASPRCLIVRNALPLRWNLLESGRRIRLRPETPAGGSCGVALVSCPIPA